MPRDACLRVFFNLILNKSSGYKFFESGMCISEAMHNL